MTSWKFSSCVLLCAQILLCAVDVKAQTDIESEGIFDDVGKIQNEEILIIQKKFFPKAGRHEVTAGILGGIPFDSFNMSLVGGASYSYHFSDSWGWEAVHGLYVKHFDTAFTSALYKQDQSPEVIRPSMLVTSSVFWNPLYGKAAIAQDYIYHADLYLLIGPGLVISEESTTVAGVVGIGVRIFANRWFTVKFEFRDYIYNEKSYDFTNPNNPTFAGKTLQNQFIISMGWSVYFPKFQFNPLE